MFKELLSTDSSDGKGKFLCGGPVGGRSATGESSEKLKLSHCSFAEIP